MPLIDCDQVRCAAAAFLAVTCAGALDGRPAACFYLGMSTVVIEIRQAKLADAPAVAAAHDEAWRSAYQGIIPGVELDKLINRRGADWWESAVRKGSRI